MRHARALPAWLAARLWPQRARLVLWLPVAMGAGNAAYFSLSREPGPLWVVAAIMICAIGAGLLRWRGGLLRTRIGVGLSCAACCGFLAAWGAAHRAAPFPDLPRRATHIEGQVMSVEDLPSPTGAMVRRVDLAHVRLRDGIDADMPPMRRTIRLRLRANDAAGGGARQDAQRITPGRWLTVRAMLRPPMPPDLPGGYDAQRRAWFTGIGGSARALEAPRIRDGGPNDAGPGDAGLRDGVGAAWLEDARTRIARRVMTVLPDGRGAMAATLLTGRGGDVSPRMRADFADSGLAHLLAVAGLHLGIVMGIGMAVTRGVLALSERASLFWPCRQIAAVAGLGLGCGYVVLTGGHLPAQRSLVMAAIATLAILTGRRVVSLRSLALAAAMLLLIEPEEMQELPMQMSVAAVMALIAGGEACAASLRALRDAPAAGHRMAGRIARLSLASVLAGTACLPVGMAHFGNVGAWFVLANLIAVPLAALWIMPFGLLALLLMPFGLDGLALVPMGWGNAVVIWLAHHVAAWPGAHVAVPQMPSWGLALFFLGLCWLCLWTLRSWRLWGCVPIACALVTPWLARPPDLVIPAQGRMVALRDGDRLLAGPRGHVDRFVMDDWTRVLDLRAGDLADETATPDGRVACRAGTCVLARHHRHIVVQLHEGGGGIACGQADFVVSLGVDRAPCPGVPRIDPLVLWRSGAQALHVDRDGGIGVLSDRAVRGTRPWVMGPGQHGTPNLPMARAE
ncbi:ComEC/Rec2 family competence protein [Novacetimonas pomaceti]|uniref:ComEC/Rec2 family competence protein n=1 Tax=Novacetimonas pomaceti TaxID=2021998 RepID=UPI001EEFAA1C|nr:ComEC/Rec2 family competence protein [Novacetimonas pomaceti]